MNGLEGAIVEGFFGESCAAESCIVGARVGVCIGDEVGRVDPPSS